MECYFFDIFCNFIKKISFYVWKSSGFCSFYFYEIYSSYLRTCVCVYRVIIYVYTIFFQKSPIPWGAATTIVISDTFFSKSSEIFLDAVDRSFTSCYFVCQLCKFYALFRCVKAIFPRLRLQGLDCDDFGESNKLPITFLAAIIAVASRCWVHVMTV